MGKIENVKVALTGEQAEALEAAVEAGEYASSSDIVREALTDWQLKRELRREEVRNLRDMWDQGVASGSASDVNFEVLRAEARARLVRERKPVG